jgi:hypothetical protein
VTYRVECGSMGGCHFVWMRGLVVRCGEMVVLDKFRERWQAVNCIALSLFAWYGWIFVGCRCGFESDSLNITFLSFKFRQASEDSKIRV